MAKTDLARSHWILDAGCHEVERGSERTRPSRGRLEAALQPGAYVLVFKSTGGRLVD
jgi:hypothetical protein